jgi:hypothetical protein
MSGEMWGYLSYLQNIPPSYRPGVRREMGILASELIFPRWHWLAENRLGKSSELIVMPLIAERVSIASPPDDLSWKKDFDPSTDPYKSANAHACLNIDQRGYGWPFVAWDSFYGSMRAFNSSDLGTIWGIDLPTPRWLMHIQGRYTRPRTTTLPVMPRVEGLIPSAAFYGVLGYVVLAGWRGVRAWRRRRRGACVACGYILGAGVGAVCPECGRKSTGASLTREIL